MGRKRGNGDVDSKSVVAAAEPTPVDAAFSGPREPVKVNNASLTELKNACDDAVKKYFSRADLFQQSYLHTDVRLALGWLSVFVAGGTAYYGYKTEFEQSKPIVWIGLIVYIILTSIQTLYACFIEGDVVFVGKRKLLDKRIETEHLTLRSTSKPSVSGPPVVPPHYVLTFSSAKFTNHGKTLLSKRSITEEQSLSLFFDVEGTMDQDAFESWLAGAYQRIGEKSSDS